MKHIIILLLISFAFSGCKKDSYDEVSPKPRAAYKSGEQLFIKHCESCHSIDMIQISTAPALGGITKRRKKKWLYKYTKNSIQMYERGDLTAQKLRSEGWGLMPPFKDLSTRDMDSIYLFIENKYENSLKTK